MESINDAMRLLQFGDSVLPVGAFSFSNGIEAAIAQRVVHDVESLKAFVKTALKQASTSDGIALIAGHRAAIATDMERIVRADRALLERKWNEETRTMTLRMGRKLAELAARVTQSPVLDDWLARIRANAT